MGGRGGGFTLGAHNCPVVGVVGLMCVHRLMYIQYSITLLGLLRVAQTDVYTIQYNFIGVTACCTD